MTTETTLYKVVVEPEQETEEILHARFKFRTVAVMWAFEKGINPFKILPVEPEKENENEQV